MASLPLKIDWDKAQTRWAQEINPVISFPPVNGTLLSGVNVVSGSNVINHKLGRTPQGWIITDISNAATIYRSAAFNSLTLTLTSNATATLSLWVF